MDILSDTLLSMLVSMVMMLVDDMMTTDDNEIVTRKEECARGGMRDVATTVYQCQGRAIRAIITIIDVLALFLLCCCTVGMLYVCVCVPLMIYELNDANRRSEEARDDRSPPLEQCLLHCQREMEGWG